MLNNLNFSDIDTLMNEVLSGDVSSKQEFKTQVIKLVDELSKIIRKQLSKCAVNGHIRLCSESPNVLYSLTGIGRYVPGAMKYKDFEEPLSGWVAGWVAGKNVGKKELENACRKGSASIREESHSMIIHDTHATELKNIKIRHKDATVDLSNTDIYSIMLTPLRYVKNNKLIGVLVIESNKKDIFKNDDLVKFIEMFAFRICPALDNMNHLFKEKEEKERFKRLNEKVGELLTKQDLGTIYDFVINDATPYVFGLEDDSCSSKKKVLKTNIDLHRKIGDTLYSVSTNRDNRKWSININKPGIRNFCIREKFPVFFLVL